MGTVVSGLRCHRLGAWLTLVPVFSGSWKDHCSSPSELTSVCLSTRVESSDAQDRIQVLWNWIYSPFQVNFELFTLSAFKAPTFQLPWGFCSFNAFTKMPPSPFFPVGSDHSLCLLWGAILFKKCHESLLFIPMWWGWIGAFISFFAVPYPIICQSS